MGEEVRIPDARGATDSILVQSRDSPPASRPVRYFVALAHEGVAIEECEHEDATNQAGLCSGM